MFSDDHGDNMKKWFLETFSGKKPQRISLLLWLLYTSSVEAGQKPVLPLPVPATLSLHSRQNLGSF